MIVQRQVNNVAEAKKSKNTKKEKPKEAESVQTEEQVVESSMEETASETEESASDTENKEAEASKESEVSSALEVAERERDSYKDALIRERADFDNYKKRNAMVSADSYKNGVADTVTKLLPVLDNFERAFTTPSEDKGFADGMAMIMRQLEDAIKALGVEEVDTSGAFDPNLHEAVMQVEEEGISPGDIAEVLQKGYRMGDRILRHAMVKVGK